MSTESSEHPNDQAKLNFILDQFSTIITEIINDNNMITSPQIKSLLSDVWDNELKKSISFIKKQIDNGALNEKLYAYGLSDKQLNLKYEILRSFVNKINKANDRITAEKKRVLFSSPQASWLRWLRSKILDFFNSFLGSLGKVIPLAEQLKEFKDMLHLLIEDMDKQGINNEDNLT